MKKGEVYVCKTKGGCEVEVKVTKTCGESSCDLVCCGVQMKKKK